MAVRAWVRALLRGGSASPLSDIGRTRHVPEAAYRLYDQVVALTQVPLLGHPIRRNETARPFFIVGAGRSGTTLCRRIVAAHSLVHVPPEARISLAIRVYRRNRHLVWEDLVRLTLAAFGYTPAFRDFDLDLGRVYVRLSRLPPSERSLARILDELYRADAEKEAPGATLWGDKTPSNARFLGSIHSVFPECRVIHMVRDGLDVTRSSVAAKVAPDVESAAKRWKTEAMAAHYWVASHPHQALTVRYEDLVQEPEQIARKITNLLDIPFEESMLSDTVRISGITRYDHLANVHKPITATNIGKGRAELSGHPGLGEIVNGTLQTLGYGPV